MQFSDGMQKEKDSSLNQDYGVMFSSLGYLNGNRFAPYRDLRIVSAFQPIYSIAHRRIVGLEGLARGFNTSNQIVSPAQLFDVASTNDAIALDRICQLVHVENFDALSPPNVWLFLNVAPHTLSDQKRYSSFLSELLAKKHYPPNRIVIEVLESMIDDEQVLGNL
tara:strand:+ start:88 stop:582 length:495 start_codon:yes stop_codon:yes gene_type:complete